jgi:hypothetical protein
MSSEYETLAGDGASAGDVTEGGRGRTGSPRPQETYRPPRRIRWVAVVVALLVLVGIGAGAWYLLKGRNTSDTVSSTGPTTSNPGPVLTDMQGLQGIKAFLGHSVYWAGPQGLTQWEVTLVGRDVYVRYLPAGEPVGSKNTYLTVGTYEKKGAYASLVAAAKTAGAKSEKLSGGALVVQPSGKPTSAYFAFANADLLMEVFDPTPGKAYQMIGAGTIQPLPAA